MPSSTSLSAASWGAIAISVISLLTFTGSLVASFFFHDPGLLNLTVGAAIANATTAVNYWLGSSSGSQKKDETIANGLRRNSADSPAAIAVANPSPESTP